MEDREDAALSASFANPLRISTVPEAGVLAELEAVVVRFISNLEAVRGLSNLDRRVLNFTIRSLEERDGRLLNSNIDNRQWLAGNTLDHLRSIRENDSLRPGFEALVNQCVVLLASYFSSGLADLFRAAVPMALDGPATEKLLNHDLRLKVREVRSAEYQLRTELADLVIASADISFQDTKSIARAFEEYLGVTIPRDADVNDIIAGLSCRHIIVHNGALVDRKCLAVLKTAMPRRLKTELVVGKPVQFTTEEIEELSAAMARYVRRVAGLLNDRLTSVAAAHDQS